MNILGELKAQEGFFMVLVAVVIGILAGYGAVGFRKLIDLVRSEAFQNLFHFLARGGLHGYAIILVPALGG